MLNELFLRIDGRIIYSKGVTSGLKKGRIKAVHFCCKSIKKRRIRAVHFCCKSMQIDSIGLQKAHNFHMVNFLIGNQNPNKLCQDLNQILTALKMD